MAIEFEMQREAEAPPARVWEALTDIDSWHEWMPNLVRIEKLTEGPLREGSRWREVRKMFGREAAEVFEVRELEPGRRMELYVDGSLGSSKRGEYRFVHTVEARGGVASTVKLAGSIGGMGKIMETVGRLFAGSMKKMIAKDLEAMVAWAEARDAAR